MHLQMFSVIAYFNKVCRSKAERHFYINIVNVFFISLCFILVMRLLTKATADRQHERIVPLARRALLRLPEGGDHIVKILDMSLSGVRIETNVCPALGTPIIVGRTPAVVVRHFDRGIACQFIKTLAVGEVDEFNSVVSSIV